MDCRSEELRSEVLSFQQGTRYTEIRCGPVLQFIEADRLPGRMSLLDAAGAEYHTWNATCRDLARVAREPSNASLCLIQSGEQRLNEGVVGGEFECRVDETGLTQCRAGAVWQWHHRHQFTNFAVNNISILSR